MPHRLGRGHSLLLSIIQTFRVHQKRTANISNSPTSTNHLGPLARYRVIYRFRRRTNHHDTPILSVNYLFLFKVSGCGAEGCLGPQFKRPSPSLCSFDPSFAPVPPPNFVHSIRSGLKILVGALCLCHALDLSSYVNGKH